MATKKKLLQAAAGSAGGGADALNVEDVFSTYLYDGNARKNAIENDINLGQSNGSGSVEFGGTINDYLISSSAIILSGDFTIEAWLWFDYNFSGQNQILGSDYSGTGGINNQVYIQNADRYLGYYDGSSAHLSTSNVPTNEWAHVAITRSGSTLTFYINGTASGTSTSTPTIQLQVVGALTGNQGFEGYMADVRIVSGSVVYTGNFTPPTTPLTAITNTQLLACRGVDPFSDNSSNSYTMTKSGNVYARTFGPFDADEAGEGGMVWLKSRSHATAHYLNDTERGTNKSLSSDSSNATGTSSTLESFNSRGFTVGSNGDVNEGGGYTYTSWTFRKAPKFFDVVTYTGTGSARTVSHNLGSEVGSIFIKRTDAQQNWAVYHRGANGGTNPEDYYFRLNQDIPQVNDGNQFNSTPPTSTEFYLGTDTDTNASGSNYVAYLFAHNDGDGDFGPDGDQDIIKCGSYTGNDGAQTIDLGFEAQWVMIKNASNTGNWAIFDVMRSFTHSADVSGPDSDVLYPNSSAAETNIARIFPTATGFGFVAEAGGTVNASGQTYMYMAIRRPMAVPTDANDVFAIDFRSGAQPSFVAPFEPDIGTKRNKDSTFNNIFATRLTGSKYLYTNSSDAQSTDGGFLWDYMNGWGNDGSASSSVFSWMWKRAPNFCDVVCYKGTGANRTVSHNLGVAPEMFWVKRRNSTGGSWGVYHKDVGNNKALTLDQSDASFNANWWNSTTPTDSLFYIGGDEATVNASGDDYIAYLFASLDGVSKVGSFTGTGSSQTIDCGFSSGARFVLVKGVDTTLGWVVFDTERGIVSGNDPFLTFNSTNAENSSNDHIDPHSSGFIVNPSMIASGSTYIFYAIA